MMKKFFGRKKLRKSKSELNGANGEAARSHSAPLPVSQSSTLGQKSILRGDDWESCVAATSSAGEEKKFDEQLDRHMMQTINDVKYVNKRPKYTAVECLDAHNALRLKYGCQPLVWSQELADLAHAWATKLADRGRILFPELPGIGENIRLSEASETSHLPTGAEVVTTWEAEAAHFNFERPRWMPKCQNFSQIVWKETSEMGVAREWNIEKGTVAIVCFYRPAGNSNAPGEFASNVPSREASMSPVRSLASTMKRSVTISSPKM